MVRLRVSSLLKLGGTDERHRELNQFSRVAQDCKVHSTLGFSSPARAQGFLPNAWRQRCFVFADGAGL